MPISCSAYNCKNRYKKGSGITFYRFPLNNARLLVKWIAAVRREDFVPSKSSALCSTHFEQSSFRYFNGRRHLKENQVPSIFDYTEHLQKLSKPARTGQFEKRIPGKVKPNAVPTKQRKSLYEPVHLECKRSVPSTKIMHFDHSYFDNDANLDPVISDDQETSDEPLPEPVADDLGSLQVNLKPSLVYREAEAMIRQIDNLKSKCSELEKEKQTLDQNLRKFLNSDQLDYLKGKHSKHWSEDTIKKALQIESACGYSGYQTLIEQGYPLPSYKTLFIRSSGTFSISSER